MLGDLTTQNIYIPWSNTVHLWPLWKCPIDDPVVTSQPVEHKLPLGWSTFKLTKIQLFLQLFNMGSCVTLFLKPTSINWCIQLDRKCIFLQRFSRLKCRKWMRIHSDSALCKILSEIPGSTVSTFSVIPFHRCICVYVQCMTVCIIALTISP